MLNKKTMKTRTRKIIGFILLTTPFWYYIAFGLIAWSDVIHAAIWLSILLSLAAPSLVGLWFLIQ
jgi:hypothetical protein